MQNIRLKLTKDEFSTLAQSCLTMQIAVGVTELRPHLTLNSVLLAEWGGRTERQVFAWRDRSNQKEYAYSLPTSVALAIHHALLLSCPNYAGQTLLEKLNQQIVNLGFKPDTVEEL